MLEKIGTKPCFYVHGVILILQFRLDRVVWDVACERSMIQTNRNIGFQTMIFSRLSYGDKYADEKLKNFYI